MKLYAKVIIILGLALMTCSCAVHGHIHRRPVPGKKKSCNCPDFGMNLQKKTGTSAAFEFFAA